MGLLILSINFVIGKAVGEVSVNKSKKPKPFLLLSLFTEF
jgi:hypothetical protein